MTKKGRPASVMKQWVAEGKKGVGMGEEGREMEVLG